MSARWTTEIGNFRSMVDKGLVPGHEGTQYNGNEDYDYGCFVAVGSGIPHLSFLSMFR